MACSFCDRDENLCSRIFYENKGWFAFLSSPPHTKGHTILAVQSLKSKHFQDSKCPQQMTKQVLRGLEVALLNVTNAIEQCYDPKPKNILLASFRGDEGHFHFHLVPLWPEEEQCWRRVTGYPKAHLMEFLGSLEKRHDFEVLWKEAKDKIPEYEQRAKFTKLISGEIEKLRKITKYKQKPNKSI
jgi:diadenosine tetraphosphate (Ap4A) HIT family hydrolase